VLVDAGSSNASLRRVTNADGRCLDLFPARDSTEAKELDAVLTPGTYKIVFKTKEYFAQSDRKCFYPWVEVWILHIRRTLAHSGLDHI
jgi:5-hydroxyisourate hydrolase-like protein (transthyretin family)